MLPDREDFDRAAFRRRLLRFFDERRRDLPWRRDADPYRVWVSEIMLQQTRVETVIPYYERWTARFPDVRALAAAAETDVLRLWEGLGYYSRARNLHRAAKVVRERHGCRLPADPDALRELPGVGFYTAGAIASIAFGVPAPAVDGNVRRVLARVFDLPAPRERELRERARALVDAARPGDFNQALMELGSLVCTPRSPACARCPVAGLCAARKNGTQLERPAPRRAARVPEDDVGTAIVVDRGGRVLLRRRPPGGLLAGLWEFPGERVGPEGSAEATAREVARRTLAAPPGEAGAVATVRHAFTHLRLRYSAFRFLADDDALDPALESPHAWVAPGALAEYPLPRAQRRLAAFAGL